MMNTKTPIKMLTRPQTVQRKEPVLYVLAALRSPFDALELACKNVGSQVYSGALKVNVICEKVVSFFQGVLFLFILRNSSHKLGKIYNTHNVHWDSLQ